jgi:hypothetical protein
MNPPSRFSLSPISHIALLRFAAALEGMVHATQDLADSLDERNVAAGTPRARMEAQPLLGVGIAPTMGDVIRNAGNDRACQTSHNEQQVASLA